MAKKKRYYKSSSMISEDRNANCNLPQNVIMKDYPEPSDANNPYSEDDFMSMDEQMIDDRSGMKKGNIKRKY